MQPAPIVLFVYNRPRHTRQTIEALRKNELAGESDLFIFSDAPKNEEMEEKVKEVREYIKNIDGFKKVTVIEREENRGLAKSIIEGVTKIVKEHGRVIVLEDDIVTSPYFLRFMNDALEFYKGQERVMHISGYVYPIETDGVDDTYFVKPASCWGWATWGRAWSSFKKDASIYLKGGLSLHPKYSFVKNIGHDGEGVHCGNTTLFDVEPTENYPIKFTSAIEESSRAREKFEKYFRSRFGRGS